MNLDEYQLIADYMLYETYVKDNIMYIKRKYKDEAFLPEFNHSQAFDILNKLQKDDYKWTMKENYCHILFPNGNCIEYTGRAELKCAYKCIVNVLNIK